MSASCPSLFWSLKISGPGPSASGWQPGGAHGERFVSTEVVPSQKLGCIFKNPRTDLQLASGGRKSRQSLKQPFVPVFPRLTTFCPQVQRTGNGSAITRASGADDQSHFTNGSDQNREVPKRRTSWFPLAAATGSIASAAASVRGILSSSANASVGDGGNGQQPPPGSGNGGGHGGGGSDAWGDSESSAASSILDERKSDEDHSRSGRIPGKKGKNRAQAEVEGTTIPRRRVNGLASLSSAAGDFLDGEAPIRGYGPAEQADSDHRLHQPLGPNLGTYSGAMPYDGFDGDPRKSMVHKYDTTDPFFLGENRPAQGDSSVAGAENRAEDSGVRDASTPAGRDSPFGVSGKPNLNKSNPQLFEHEMGPEKYYNHSTSRGSHHQVPQEFSSIRGKITEIPGYVREGTRFRDDQHESLTSGFSAWVGGFFDSIVGNRTGGEGADSGSGDQNASEVEREKLVSEVASRALQLIADQASQAGLAKGSETGALRRLQRETFSDLMKIRDRLEKLEHFRRGSNSEDSLAGVKTTLKGQVNSGGAFVLFEDLTSNISRYSLQHAGMLTGLDVRFTFETPMRENDILTTQCGVGQVSGESDGSILGGPISLQKINYVAQINDTLSLAVAPLGARASDMSDTVNHLRGEALTTFGGSGPSLYQHCRGSAVGISLRSNSVLLSMSQFLSGWGDRAPDATIGGPLCLSTLAQFMVQPFEQLVFSLSAVNNLWPSPPLPSSSGFHWSEMGPLVLCKTFTRPTQPTGTFTFNDLRPSSSSNSFFSQGRLPERDSWSADVQSRAPVGSSGTAMQAVAFSGEMDLGGNVSVGGWAQVERADWLQELEKKELQWNLSLAKSSGSNLNWGVSVGRRKWEDWGEDEPGTPTSGPIDSTSSQLQVEAFVKLKIGRGFALQPGIVYIVDKYTQTPAFMLRSSWKL